jgi:hypothetical protein
LEIGLNGIGWIDVAVDKDHRMAIMNTAIEYSVSITCGESREDLKSSNVASFDIVLVFAVPSSIIVTVHCGASLALSSNG